MMNADTIVEAFPKVKDAVDKLGDLVEDYRSCKSEISKKLIGSAIEKYASSVTFGQ